MRIATVLSAATAGILVLVLPAAALAGSAPKDVTLPTVSGTLVVGQSLTASKGTWTEAPTSYAYQWEKCNSEGLACGNITGATGETYVLVSEDIGKTLAVEVKATNAFGTGKATSKATGVVAEKFTHCFENPETEGTARIEACGYPGPKNVGAEVSTGKKCSELTSTSGLVILKKGETYTGKNLTGHIRVEGSNVTINNDCITDKQEAGNENAVEAESGASGLTVENSTIHGENHETKAIETAIVAVGAGNLATKDYMYNCGECVHGEWTVSKSYLFVNGFTPISKVTVPTTGEQVHLEGYYLYGGQTAVVKEDTIINPEDNALFFGDTFDSKTSEVCENHVTLEDNFLVGSGFPIYICANGKSGAEGEGTSTTTIKGNRFARCLGTPFYEEASGGTKCGTGKTELAEGFPTVNPGADAYGYWPQDGYYGLAAIGYSSTGSFKTGGSRVWEDNFWDNNLETCPEIEWGNCT